MNFGFLTRYDEQGASFHQFGVPPSGAPALLSHAGDETCRVIFLGRLYYRGDLRRRLTDAHRPAATSSAAQHVLAAYRQGGLEGLTWIEGDYAFVLWDARERRLLAARDPQGGFPLFWVRDGDAVVVLADALPGVLPAKICDRRNKGHFNEVFFTGLSRNTRVLESLVRDAQVDDLEFFDQGELVRCLHKAALGIGKDGQGVDRLNLTLALLKWRSTQQKRLRDPAPRIRRLDPVLSGQPDQSPTAELRSSQSLVH